MIPTQPGVNYPFNPDNTWRDPFRKGWQCPSCGQFIGDMQYHSCPGPSAPLPVQTGTITDLNFGGGMMSDILMYDEFKKLFRKDTLSRFRERFLGRLADLGQQTPKDSGDPVFGVDAIMDVFDDVAKGINFNSNL